MGSVVDLSLPGSHLPDFLTIASLDSDIQPVAADFDVYTWL